MKRFCLFMMLLFNILAASCVTAKEISQSQITRQDDEVAYVLYNHYPQLYDYYVEGVLRVNLITETQIDYDFVRYYYIGYNERAEALKLYYPSVYSNYINGSIIIDSFYKYVDRESGQIRHYLSYRWAYNYYYRPYISGRMYYRPAPPPPPRPRPRVEPRKPHHTPTPPPAHRPPQTRPSNPPAHHNSGSHRVGSGNPPHSQPGGHTTTRPSNPPRSQHTSPSSGNHGGHTARPGGTNSRRR